MKMVPRAKSLYCMQVACTRLQKGRSNTLHFIPMPLPSQPQASDPKVMSVNDEDLQ